MSYSSNEINGTAFDSAGNQTSWTASKIVKEKGKKEKT
jgi:hypothetical protein